MKHMNLRLPDEVHDALTRMAEGEDRSLNNMVIVLIKEGQQRRPAKANES